MLGYACVTRAFRLRGARKELLRQNARPLLVVLGELIPLPTPERWEVRIRMRLVSDLPAPP